MPIGHLDALPHPAHALRRVFQHDAFLGQLVADRIGAGEITRLLRRDAFIDQLLDARIVVTLGAACKPFGGRLLQQAEHLAGAE